MVIFDRLKKKDKQITRRLSISEQEMQQLPFDVEFDMDLNGNIKVEFEKLQSELNSMEK